MKPAYYNEFDPYAAQWLRNLIAAGHIAPGDVDERSIEDVRADDLVGYGQCHFFAGIGVWSHALRRAGIPDEYPIWTGSCPCQPFSAAGQGEGFADERHLWPAFFHLISQRRPAAVLGEQVASGDADPWVDLVCADLESLGYAFGALAFPTAGVGAPHIRDRLYWGGISGVALGHTGSARLEGRSQGLATTRGWLGPLRPASEAGGAGRMADDDGQRWGEEGQCELPTGRPERAECGGDAGGMAVASSWGPQAIVQCGEVARTQEGEGRRGHQLAHAPRSCGEPEWMADTDGGVSGQGRENHGGRHQGGDAQPWPGPGGGGVPGARPGPVNGFWRTADWLLCRDGRWRPVEPGTFPLVDGASSRVGRVRADWAAPAGKGGQGNRAGGLKGYGNAISAEAAIAFINCIRQEICSGT